MMQGQPLAGQPQQPMQQGGTGNPGMDLAQTVNQYLQQNPDMQQKIHQALQQAQQEGVFEELEPQEMQQVMGVLQQIVESPETYPQQYQQIMQMGGNPQDFPPPNTPIEQIKDFAGGLLVVMYYMGELGIQAGGMQGGDMQGGDMQGGDMQGGGMQGGQPPPQGMQGFAFGGNVVNPSQSDTFNVDSLRFLNQANQRTPGASNFSSAPVGAGGQNLDINNVSNLMTMQDSNAPNAQGAATQALYPNYKPYPSTVQGGGNPNFPGSTSGFQNPEQRIGPIGTTPTAYGTLYTGRDTMAPALAERDLLAQEWMQHPASAATETNARMLWGRNLSTAQSGGNEAGRNFNTVRGVPYENPNDRFSITADMRDYQKQMLQRPHIQRDTAVNGFYNPNTPTPGGQPPWDYYRISGFNMPGRQAGLNPTPIRGVSHFQAADPWTTNLYGSLPGVEQQSIKNVWQDAATGRSYPVGSQRQLNEYISYYNKPEGERKGQFDSGLPWWKKSQHPNWGTYFTEQTKGLNPKADFTKFIGGAHGMNVPPPTNNGMQTNTGDDQMIAAKTGEGVLNVDAVRMIGGPEVVNQLNYNATGVVPGGRDVQVQGYNYGGNVRKKGYNYGGVVSDTIPGAVMQGFGHGGMVGGDHAIAASGWVWSDAANKYVEVRRSNQKFSGRVLKAMGVLGLFGKFMSMVVSIVGMVVVPGIGTAFGALAAAGAGAVFGAAAGALSTGSLKGALFGGAIGGILGGASAYFGGSGFLSGAPSPSGFGPNAGGAFSSAPSTGINFGPSVSAPGFATNLDAAAGFGVNAGTGVDPTILGSAGFSGVGGTGPLLNPSFGTGAGPLLSQPGAGQVLNTSNVVGMGPGQQTQAPGLLDTFKQKGNTVLSGIVDNVTDPRNILRTGGALLGGALAERPNFGADGYNAMATNELDRQSSLNQFLDDRYRNDRQPLVDQSSYIASIAANPQMQGTSSSNAYKLGRDRERDRLHDELVRMNKGPGSPAYTDAMRKFQSDSSLGGIQAYNTGVTRGVQTGQQALGAAANLYEKPNHAASAGQYATIGSFGAQAKRDEWNAQNESARQMANLIFPSNPDDELYRARELSNYQQGR